MSSAANRLICVCFDVFANSLLALKMSSRICVLLSAIVLKKVKEPPGESSIRLELIGPAQ